MMVNRERKGNMTDTQKNIILAKLRDAGFNRVEIEFSGGNDEGGAEGGVATKVDGSEFQLDFWNSGDSPFDHETIQELQKPIYDRYYTFAGEFYVWGKLIWDVPNNRVYMSGDEEVPTSEPFEVEVD